MKILNKLKKMFIWVILISFSMRRGVPGERRAAYLKKAKVFHGMGENCYWHPAKIPAEPNLVSLHNNVVVCANVEMITHDVIYRMIRNNPKYKNSIAGSGQYLNRIEIMDNVMIGAHSIILPGVTIGPNVIVAAGSVVVKNVPEGVLVGGNPAKVIGTMEEFVTNRCKVFSEPPFLPRRSIKDVADFFWNMEK